MGAALLALGCLAGMGSGSRPSTQEAFSLPVMFHEVYPGGKTGEEDDITPTDLTEPRWPRVMGFSWWNEFWENDGNPAHDTTMRVQDNPALAKVFQTLVGSNDQVLGRLYLPRGISIERPR